MNRFFNIIVFAGSPRFEHDRKVVSAFLQKCGLAPTSGVVLVLDGPPRMESVLDILEKEILSDLILFAPGADSEELAVRLAVRKGGTSMTDVLAVTEMPASESTDANVGASAVLIDRTIYNGHLTGTFTLENGPFFLALDRSLPEADPQETEQTFKLMPVKTLEFLPSEDPLHGSNRQVLPPPEDTGLADAPFILAGGRGLGSPAKAERFLELADKLGASAGGTRPAVMNGWMPLDRLIGVSGTLVHPQVCLVCGASGSAAFMAGIAQSRTIIAVNTDEKAPLAKQADAFICENWESILTELQSIIPESK